MSYDACLPLDALDIPELVDLLVLFHGENGLAPLDLEKTVEAVMPIVQNGLAFGVWRGEDGELVGVLGLIESPFWYGPGSFLHDQFFYVLPDYRAKGVGDELLEAAKEVAEKRNSFLLMDILNPLRAKRCGRVSNFLGFFPAGYTVRMR